MVHAWATTDPEEVIALGGGSTMTLAVAEAVIL